MPTLLPDQVIGGKYRIVKLLGAGGMGAVYEVHQMDIGRRAALKLLTLEVQAQPGYFQRFMNEARAVNQINHPGVVQVYDFGLEAGQPWLVMEYLEGASLSDHMKLALEQPRRAMGMEGYWIIGELASVLDEAHRKGIIHRDLKPANVMVIPDPHSPTGQRVKLLDFGVAKLCDSDALTKSGSILGTPLYMALEQFKNSADVDGKADVFALGVIAYQMLTGRLPHFGATHYEIMGARLLNPIKPLSQLAPHVPASVAALVMAMLEKEPAQRPTMATVDLEVRRTLGLPLPRASGFHHMVAPGALNPTVDDERDPTANVPIGTLDLMQAQPPTPSGEKVAGELSPRDVPVPISLSSMPSVPVPAPPLRASPADRTTAGAPEALPAVALASPSSPTASDNPPRRPRFMLGAALALCAVAGTSAAVWLRQQHKPTGLGVGDAAPPVVLVPSSAAPPVTAAGTGLPLDKRPAEPTIVTPQNASPARPGAVHCEAQALTKSCIITPQLTMRQRDRLFAAFDQSGAAFCPSESIVLSGLPDHPQLGNAPSLRGADALVGALRQQLGDSRFPSEIEIKCQKLAGHPVETAPPGVAELAAPAATVSSPPAVKPSAHKRCQAVLPSAACVLSRTITDAQKTAVVKAMFDASIKLCPSDRLVVMMSSTDLGIRSAPSTVNRETQDVFVNSLRGRLRGTSWRGELEIRCPAP